MFKSPAKPVCPTDGVELRPLATSLPGPGDPIGKHYTIDRRIAEGGMCTIFSAFDRTNGTDVAIKILNPELATRPGQSQAMIYEASLSMTLDDENLVRCFDGGISRDGYHFMVMDLLRGKTLAHVLGIRGRVCLEDACEIFMGTARALEALHGYGHVHRDVKPENIFLRGEPAAKSIHAKRVKLLDMGVARPISEYTDNMTVYGTPEYMSPEQVAGRPLDQRSDLYSLGVVLFEMLTGKQCFWSTGSSTPYKTMLAHVRQPVPCLPDSFYVDETGRKVAKILSALLAKNPADRPQSAIEAAGMIPLDSIRQNNSSRLDFSFFENSDSVGLQ